MNITQVVSQASYLEMAKALNSEYWRPLSMAELSSEEKALRKAQYRWAWGVLDARRSKERPRTSAHPEYLVGYDGGPPPERSDGQEEEKDQSPAPPRKPRRSRKRN